MAMIAASRRDESAQPPPPARVNDEYVEVELRLRAAASDGTPAELRATGVRTFPETRVPLDVAALAAVADAPLEYGQALGRQLFDGTVLGAQLGELRAAVESRGRPWRLRLRLDDAALEALHWERLCVPSGGAWAPIGAGAATPFSRYAFGDWGDKPAIVDRPVAALLVVASPTGLDGYGLHAIPDEDVRAVREALGAPGDGELRVEELRSGTATPPTLANLRATLTRAPAIVHVLCHGVKGPGGTALLLEDADGAPEPVEAADIVAAVRGADPPPRLVVLAACESAATDGTRAFVSLGPALAAHGVDAVVAMSAPVAVGTARQFCTQLYARLFAHGVVDRAVNEARAAVLGEWDWGVPVLFSRLADAQLLDFPVGRVDAEYLDYSNRLVRAVAEARGKQAGGDDVADQTIAAMDALVEELEKSHRVLTRWGSDFRRVGADPATFAADFRRFYLDFKEYYDNKHFGEERTHCGQVSSIAPYAIDALRAALTDDEFRQLDEDLGRIVGADGTIVEFLSEFLDRMDAEVEAIQAMVSGGDLAAAIQRKQTFEMQLSPSFRRSKALLAEIGERAGRVAAA